LYDTIGDTKARNTIAECISLMTKATERHNGRLIKTIGDEVMTTFENVDDAAHAASEMQENITQDLVVDGRNIEIRTGFHFGPAIIEMDDVFGDAVNIAARMAGQAKAGQILTTASTVARLSDMFETRQIDRAHVKGKRNEIDVCEIIWQREDVTRMVASQSWTRPAEVSCLVLEYRDQKIEVGEKHPAIVMGRSDQNDLVIKHNLVSRMHARIEYRRGNFILIDQSINGTYIVMNDGKETLVRRDNVPIRGKGVIGLGQSLDDGSPEAIHFTYSE
jgi:hypothetical protein